MKCSPCLPKLVKSYIDLIDYKDAHPDSVIGRNLYYDAVHAAINDANDAVTIRNGAALCSNHLLKAIQLYKR